MGAMLGFCDGVKGDGKSAETSKQSDNVAIDFDVNMFISPAACCCCAGG